MPFYFLFFLILWLILLIRIFIAWRIEALRLCVGHMIPLWLRTLTCVTSFMLFPVLSGFAVASTVLDYLVVVVAADVAGRVEPFCQVAEAVNFSSDVLDD